MTELFLIACTTIGVQCEYTLESLDCLQIINFPLARVVIMAFSHIKYKGCAVDCATSVQIEFVSLQSTCLKYNTVAT
jgi:hypothetical protein